MPRLNPISRKAVIMTATIKAIKEHGILTFTDEQVSELCNVETSVGTIRRYYATRGDLIKAACLKVNCPVKIKKQAQEMGIIDK